MPDLQLSRELVRIDGYAPIRDYAVVGDGRTVALVAGDGSIDWLCLPNLDSPSVCGRLLDAARGGRFAVCPDVPFEWSRRYLGDTNILETTFTCELGSVRVIDAMLLPDDRLSPMRELARVVEGISGSVPVRWVFEPRFNYGKAAPRWGLRYGYPTATWGRDAIAICSWDAGTASLHDGHVEGRVEVGRGQRSVLTLAASYGEPLVLPDRHGVESRLARTQSFWERWASQIDYEGPWRDAVLRSALTLKLMISAASGASAAAPTTSLPEEIGGVRNWDYRFCWIRDSAFLTDALLQLGFRAEAQALFWWFMQATALTEPRLQVLYRLDGGARAPERELGMSGYRNSRPVRVGNAAVNQRQLDIYGDLLETAWLYAKGDHRLDRDTGKVFARIADLVCRIWREPDAGIWEVRGPDQHFTHSKVMCWACLDRAIRLAEAGEVPATHVPRWSRERAAIEQFVHEKCWSERRQSYVRAAGSEDMDASLLMLPLVGFGTAHGTRITSTIDAVATDLLQNPFVFRYRTADGLPGSEGCFLTCSFWLAGALARSGRIERASRLMDDMLAQANDVGLFAEQENPSTGEFLGNFPQALTHLSLIDAALAVASATTGHSGPQKGKRG